MRAAPVVTGLFVAAALGLFVAAMSDSSGNEPQAASKPDTAAATTSEAPEEAFEDAREPGHRSDRRRLSLRTTLGGAISPKSVAASGTGLVFAQNMMYRHSVTVYDAKRVALKATIPDTVRLNRLGWPEYRGTQRGAPVEAAFSPDGKYGYVTNYSMYGSDFGPEGSDVCTPSSGYDRSFTYRIRLDTLKIDQAYRVGAVPKVVATTPDGKYVLVSNWCTYDLSVISTAKGKEVRRIPIGAYPRGVTVSKDSKKAYVAVMGGSEVISIDLTTWRTKALPIGSGPRALSLHPSGRYLFATLNAAGRVARLDLRTGRVVSVATGTLPRSMDIAPDGRSLYVVNYEGGTVSKVRTVDMRVLETDEACYHPIGITYEPVTSRVWVACYGGSILVYDDKRA
ncbi:MAG: YncE family protein [Thermoleophilia bacterium]